MRSLTWMALAVAGIATATAQTAVPAAPAPGVEESAEQKRDERTAGTVAEVAREDPALQGLARAIEAAGLGDTLAEPGPYTIFAPSNEAFGKDASGKADLTYHVVPGKIRSQDIPMGVTEIPTLQGEVLRVERTDAGIAINGARIVTPDILASNGTIHTVDRVLVPTDRATH